MKKGINLIPASILAARARKRRLRAWIVADVLLGGVGALALFALQPATTGRVERLRSEYESARTTLALEQEHLAQATASLRQAKMRHAVARRIGARPDFSGLMQVLGDQLEYRTFLEQVIIAPQILEGGAPMGAGGGGAAIPAAASVASGSGAATGQAAPPSAPQRYQLLISGVATNMSAVNALILRLDETGYFSQVWPASSSAREVGTVRGVEFKIVATLGEGRLADALLPQVSAEEEQP